MKPLILLLFFGLGSCHVHYHIAPKNEPIKTNCDNRFYPIAKHISYEGCGVIGCAVYHEATLTPTIFIDTSYINRLNSNK